jgi:hypothetical protein
MVSTGTWRSAAVPIIVGMTVVLACALVLRSVERSMLSAAAVDAGQPERADLASI